MDRRDFLTLASLAPLARLGAESQTYVHDIAYVPSRKRAEVVFRLPQSSHRRIAWTVDDGCSALAIHRYIDHIEKHDGRLTFFIYAAMRGWRTNQHRLQPFVDSGQIQLGNHTYGHPDLRTLSSSKIRRQLLDCHNYLLDVFGVDARPYFRPPYGAYNNRVREVAADLGYTKLMMWSGTLGDSGHISLAREYTFGRRYMNNGTVLLGHANNMNADKLFERLYRVTTNRRLELVTLADAIGPTYQHRIAMPTPLPSTSPITLPSELPSIAAQIQ